MRKFVVFAGVLACASAAHGTIIFQDDFESYANRAAMFAPGAWGDLSATPAPLADLITTGGNPGQYASHPGTPVAPNNGSGRHAFPAINTNAGTIIWEFDFRSDGGTQTNKRMTSGLRVGNGTPLLEMGMFNAVDNPENGGINTAGYAIRTVGIGGPAADGGWITFVGNPTPRNGWHHFRATLTPTSALFELDFDDDGTVDASRQMLGLSAAAGTTGWNAVRWGVPSDTGNSAGGGGDFDNFSISQIPEPSALALLAIGGLLLRRRA